MKNLRLFLGISTLLGFLLLSSCNQTDLENKKVELPTSRVLEIESEYVENTVYQLFIDLPPSYGETDKNYPVVYLLDAYDTYGLMLQTYQALIFQDEITEMIIVGISYKIEGDFYTKGLQKDLDLRARDFLPTYLPMDTTIKPGQKFSYIRYSGGGGNFLNFIEKELIPFIETEFRADPENRGLFGYSLGGTFTTFSMFSKPGLFKYYFIGSPYLGWDNKAVYRFDNTDKLIGTKDTINIYISSGELEYGGRRHSLTDYLKGKNNPNMILRSELLAGETHLSGIGLAYSRAFRRLYGVK